MAKITLSTLRNAKPGAVLPDPALDGLLRYRVRNSGRIFAELRHKANGKWQAAPLGRVDLDAIMYDLTYAEAEAGGERDASGRPVLTGRIFAADEVLAGVREKARAMQSQLRRGEDPRGRDTLGAVAASYLQDIKGERRPRTFIEIERHLTKDWRPLHGKRLQDITDHDVDARLDEIKAKSGPVARNRARASLRALFHAKRRLVPVNPVDLTDKVREAARKRVLSDDELRAVWNATDGTGDFDRIIRLCILTGLRKTQVGAMRWVDVDLERERLALPDTATKNADPLSVPLSAAAVDILRALREAQEAAGEAGRAFVFGRNGTAFSGWSRAEQRLYGRAQLPHFTVHDLRRTMRTNLGRLKVAREIRELAIGHRLKGIEAVYDLWTYEEEKRDAVDRWAALLARIVSPAEEPAKVISLHRHA